MYLETNAFALLAICFPRTWLQRVGSLLALGMEVCACRGSQKEKGSHFVGCKGWVSDLHRIEATGSHGGCVLLFSSVPVADLGKANVFILHFQVQEEESGEGKVVPRHC